MCWQAGTRIGDNVFLFLPHWLKYGEGGFMKYLWNILWIIASVFSVCILGSGIWFLISKPQRRRDGEEIRKSFLFVSCLCWCFLIVRVPCLHVLIPAHNPDTHTIKLKFLPLILSVSNEGACQKERGVYSCSQQPTILPFLWCFLKPAVESSCVLDQNYIVEDELSAASFFPIIPEVGWH